MLAYYKLRKRNIEGLGYLVRSVQCQCLMHGLMKPTHIVDCLRIIYHDWCNKGRGMCNPVCGMVHIKEPLLLIGKNSPFNSITECFRNAGQLVLYVQSPDRLTSDW